VKLDLLPEPSGPPLERTTGVESDTMYWKDWDRLETGIVRERQGAMLHRFLKTQVLPYSPFYRDLFKREGLTADDIRSVGDLRKIPLTSKVDIAPTSDHPDKPRRLVLQPDPKTYASSIGLGKKVGLFREKLATGRHIKDLVLDEYLPVFFIATTGRTANPTPFFYSKTDMALFEQAGKRLFEISEVRRADDFVISIFPYAPHLAFWIVYQGGIVTGTPVFHTGGGKVMGTDRIASMIEKFDATVMIGIPGYTYHLLRIAQEKGADYSKIRLVVLGAERVTVGYKRRLLELLTSMGAKEPIILSTYGFTEARVAWMECPTANSVEETTRYHLYPDMHIFEIIDPDSGEPVGDGESGEIAITCLDWRGSVVLRYRTGDYAKGGITWQPCPVCGRKVPRLSTNITRLSDRGELQLSKVKGTLVDFNEFFPIMHDQKEILEWQVEITKRNGDPHELDEIHLHLTVREGSECDEVVRRVCGIVRERMELSIENVLFHDICEMTDRLGMETNPKEIRIRDRRKEFQSMEE